MSGAGRKRGAWAALGGMALVWAVVPGALAAGKGAGNGDCDGLVQRAIRAGDLPQVVIHTDDGTVGIRTSEGQCREPIEVWSQRRIDWVPVTPDAPKQGQRGQYVPAVPGRGPSAAGGGPEPEPGSDEEATSALPPSSPRRYDAPPCDAQLTQYWREGGRFKLDDLEYELVSVFTIDLDRDGVVDNVGFRFRAGGKGSGVVLRYFAGLGQRSATSLPGLALADDSAIGRLCFGRVSFGDAAEDDDFFDQGSDSKKATAQATREARARHVDERRQERNESRTGVGSWLWLALGAGAVFLFAVAGLWLMVSRMGRGHDELDDLDRPPRPSRES